MVETERRTLKTNEPNSVIRMSPALRAAIVIAMLGEELAKPIVEKLDDAALAKVTAGLDTLSLLGKDELSQIVIDFLGHLRNTPGGFVTGKLSTRDMVSNVINLRNMPKTQKTSRPDNSPSLGPRNVWAEIAGYPAEQLSEYMNGLTPNLVAIIINKLPVTLSSEIFNFIDDDKLKQIMRFMVEATELEPGVENAVSRMIEIEFLNSRQSQTEDKAEHLPGIGELLSLIPSEKRAKLVSFLEADHSNKISAIQGALFTIEGLPTSLPRSAVPVVFRDMDTSEIVRLLSTLQGAYAEAFDFLLSNISSRLANQIKEQLAGYKVLSAEEAEICQRNFLMRIMSLKRAGDIPQ